MTLEPSMSAALKTHSSRGVMVGGITDDGELAARVLFQLTLDDRTLGHEVIRTKPVQYPCGDRPFGHRAVQLFVEETQADHQNADSHQRAGHRAPDGLASRSPDVEVPHRLQTNCIESRRERREIVRKEEYLYRRAAREDDQRDHHEAHAAIADSPWKHEQGRN